MGDARVSALDDSLYISGCHIYADLLSGERIIFVRLHVQYKAIICNIYNII